MVDTNLVTIGGKNYVIVKSSRVIEATGKKGAKFWQNHILECEDGKFYTSSSSWKETTTGTSKVIWSEPYFAEPTNVGRANERDNEAQAYFEFESTIQKQSDKREADKPLPMLAATFIDKKNPKKSRRSKIQFPCFVQPKFDGMRMLYDGKMGWSRGNKEILPAVLEHLQFDTSGYIFDGELILPDNPKVNVTRSATAKFQSGVSDKLVYRVYDLVIPDLPFKERFLLLKTLIKTTTNLSIIIAETHLVMNETQGLALHGDFTSRGFEGSIWRNMDGLYAIGKRVDDLQKHKDWIDEEFEIIDVIPAGGGSSADVGKFVCRAENGNTFESTATGTVGQRREYLINKQNYIGKFAKVKYRELSGATQVPFHSNVLEIRDTKEGGY